MEITPNDARRAFEVLAQLVTAYQRCEERAQIDWRDRHESSIQQVIDAVMPHGSGFDSGTEIALADCSAERLIFDFSYHHMDEHGYYCGWTDHRVTVTPSFLGRFQLRISGPNKRESHYFYELFDACLNERVIYVNADLGYRSLSQIIYSLETGLQAARSQHSF